MKAAHAREVKKFVDIPNIGPSMAADFELLGIQEPADLKGKDAFTLYKKLCQVTHTRQDPCVLDTFIAAIDFMNGAPARPWWDYTVKRKKDFPEL